MHSKIQNYIRYVLVAGIILASISVLVPGGASAAQLQQRSIAIDDSTPGVATTHTFKFSYTTTSLPVGSMIFQYCTSPLLAVPCDAPAGINASHAVLAQQVGEGGYFVLTAQTGTIILTRAPALPPNVNPSSYKFTGIQNPSGVGIFYVRITTYMSTDGSGAYTDFGSVANSTTQGVHVNGEVPPYLKFCVGLTIDTDCTSADGSVVDMGDLTPSKVSSGSSQMLAATNAEFGLSIAVYGTTMTAGTNEIAALSSPTVSAPGNAQFGLNLRANTNPGIGQNPSGGGIANPTAAYNTPNRYTFNSGDVVATSPAVTDTRKFTASYVANISPNQAPGVYTATLTYICTATF